MHNLRNFIFSVLLLTDKSGLESTKESRQQQSNIEKSKMLQQPPAVGQKESDGMTNQD